ncbi:class I SAM-dependent methyltransferase [Radicibacter daui]|uniref:class I SAM-dependent methyltransferase n=1 Tax=Radicibacter daui TaxID=3064829 RepID=UPI004046CEBC
MSLLVAAYRLAQDVLIPERFSVRRFLRAAVSVRRTTSPAMGIDVGAGTGPYRRELTALAGGAPVLNLDIVHRDTTDLVADAAALPLAGGSAGLISLFHVLQHVIKPADVLGEAARVALPEGLLIVDFPFMTCEGRSSDLRRWTMAGMQGEVEQAGFEVVEATRLGGFFFLLTSTLSDLPGRLLVRHARGWQAGRGPMASAALLLAFALAVPFHLLGFLALGLDHLLPASPYYAGGLVLARKKAGHG